MRKLSFIQLGDSLKMRVMITAFAGLAAAGIGKPVYAESLTVGAPHTVRAAFEEIVPIFEREYGAAVNILYRPSKTLLHQIETGAPIDVFLFAGIEKVEHLSKKRLTLNGYPRLFAQTSLVLVLPADSPAMLLSLTQALSNHTTRIALGDPETSYLGEVTAREMIKRYPTYKRHSHLIYASHSEEILTLIRTGKADVGVVYRANLINTGYVRISDEAPVGPDVSIQFGQAVVSNCRTAVRVIAEQFSDFLMTPRIQGLLVKHGFDPPSSSHREYAGRQKRSSEVVP
ncbi:MAG: molybdate ABC transporter substrate-binding protein [Nitrospiraceae bacterium]